MRLFFGWIGEEKIKIAQRIHDWRHERLIKELARKCTAASRAGHKSLARMHFQAMRDACLSRSAAQVERMERAGGVR